MRLEKTPVINKEATGKRLRRLVSDNGITIDEILTETQAADSTVSAWFRGDTIPSIINLLKIAWMCDCEITDIIVVSWVNKE